MNKHNQEIMKKIGASPGRVVPDLFKRAFMSEEQAESMRNIRLRDMARKLLEDERAAEKALTTEDLEEKKPEESKTDANIPCEIHEKNPSKVEDKTSKQDKSLAKAKKIPVPGAPKFKESKTKYTNLSNYIPAQITRAEKTEIPTVKDGFDKESLDEKEYETVDEIEKDFDKKHIIQMKDIIKGS